MMDDSMPVPSNNVTNTTLDEETNQMCCDMCAGKTVKQLKAMSNLIMDKAYELEQKVEANVTMEDFEKLKKQDVDTDNEVGE